MCLQENEQAAPDDGAMCIAQTLGILFNIVSVTVLLGFVVLTIPIFLIIV